ncbi:MAG: Cytochrome c oxidase assembly protein cox15 [Pycnora praestabilis]|nr:MAG: Cytochrome c oxidase assembly protein cox15 [Pycnora praestabilis]
MAFAFQSLPTLRRAAPRLSRKFFTCRQCLGKAPSSPLPPPSKKSVGRSPYLPAFRSKSTHAPASASSLSHSVLRDSSPLGSLSRSINKVVETKPPHLPQTSERVVAYFLLGSAASVFGIVVFGGLTRLTESGLSITEWRPVTGSLPPRTGENWDSEFSKYKSSPEFKLLNPHMTLDEFKYIYYMEWTHRLWGRAIGLSFLLPSIYFIARRKVSARMAAKLFGIAGLIGLQGVLGWWMVKSGLKDDLFAPGSYPRVSQYRLTAHLGTAFLCYTAMLWNGLSILRENKLLKDPIAADKTLSILRDPNLKVFRRSVGGLALLVFCTAMSGGLVAGLDAGLIYNEFPYMGLGLTPPRSELFSDFYSRRTDGSDIWWRNMLENPSTVQLDHRILATTSFTAIMSLWAYSRFSPQVRAVLPKAGRTGMLGVVGLVWLQVTMGICTLIYLVPLPLASAHQAGSLALLTGVVVLGSRVWVPKRVAKLVAERLAKSGLAPAKGGLRSPGMENVRRVMPSSPKGAADAPLLGRSPGLENLGRHHPNATA